MAAGLRRRRRVARRLCRRMAWRLVWSSRRMGRGSGGGRRRPRRSGGRRRGRGRLLSPLRLSLLRAAAGGLRLLSLSALLLRRLQTAPLFSTEGPTMKLTRRAAALGGLGALATGALSSRANALDNPLSDTVEGTEDFEIASDAYIYGYPLVTMEMRSEEHT